MVIHQTTAMGKNPKAIDNIKTGTWQEYIQAASGSNAQKSIVPRKIIIIILPINMTPTKTFLFQKGCINYIKRELTERGCILNISIFSQAAVGLFTVLEALLSGKNSTKG